MSRRHVRQNRRPTWRQRWHKLTAPRPILVLTGRRVTATQASPLRQALPYLMVAVLAAATGGVTVAYFHAQQTIQDQSDTLTQLEQERDRLSERLAAARQEKRQWQERASAAEGQVNDMAPALEETRDQLQRVRHERDALARTVDQLETDLKHHSQRGAGLARQLRQANDEIGRLKQKRDQLVEKVKARETRVNDLTRKLEARKAELADTQEALQTTRSHLEQRTARLAAVRAKRSNLKKEVAELQNDLDAALEGRNAQLRRWREQRQARRDAEEELAQMREKYRQTQARAERLAGRLDAVSDHTQAALARLTKLTENRRQTIQTALADIDANIGQLAQQVRKEALPGGVGGPLEPEKALPVPAPNSAGAKPVAALKERMSEMNASADKLGRLQGLMSKLPLARPVDHYYVSSEYGYRDDPFTGQQAMHAGIDLAGLANTPIYAAAPGKVVKAGYNSAYGRQVVIDHGLGIRTRYGHLRATTVEAGETVGVRELVGRMGSTGRSEDTHLHYEVEVNEQRLDPQQFIEAGSEICPL